MMMVKTDQMNGNPRGRPLTTAERYELLKELARDLSGSLDGIWVDRTVSEAKQVLDAWLSSEAKQRGN